MHKGSSFKAIAQILLIITLLVAGTATAEETTRWAPDLVLPNDTSYNLCGPQSICFDVAAVDPDVNDELILTLLSGPIVFPPDTLGPDFVREVCFDADQPGEYKFVFQLVDKQIHIVTDSVTFTVSLTNPPVLADQDFSLDLCSLKEPRMLHLAYDDPYDAYRFRLLSGMGTIDSLSGIITYQPDTSGEFHFEVEVSNECASDTALITDIVTLNLPPHCIGFDSTFYLCGVEEICFDVFTFDPEGDEIFISQIEGLGTFVQTSDTSGTTCFTPADLPVGNYMFIYRTVDSCILASGGEEFGSPAGPCCLDTVNITVIIDNPPTLVCPDSQSFFACDSGTFCFDIEVENEEGDSTAISIISGNATVDGTTICVFADQTGTQYVVIVAEDECGADTCTVPVTVDFNRPPYVTMPEDASVLPCVAQTLCLVGVFADDLDFNLENVSANYGTYNAGNNSLCYLADTSGVYTIILTATDSCGLSAADTTVVTIDINSAPTVSFGDDYATKLCDLSEICVDVDIFDANGNIGTIINNFGSYDSQTGQICFTPDSSGHYLLTMYVSDDCDESAVDSIAIDVDLGSAPTIANFGDTTLSLCYPQEICLTPEIYDANNDITSIVVSAPYTIDSLGRICFVPYSMGDYEVVLTVTDDCGNVAVDTAAITILTDQMIDIVCPSDTSIFLCEADTLCFPIGGVPEGATVELGGTNVWWNEQTNSVCFYSDCCLENIITVDVTTECGTYSCQFTVNVKTNVEPLVILPADTALLLCDVTEICFPIGITDADKNVLSVSVAGGTYDDYNDLVCFTPDTAGLYVITVTAIDECGREGMDEFTVQINLNSSPQAELTAPVFEPLCTLPSEIVLGFEVSDVDENIVDVSSLLGTIDGDSIRFVPTSFGSFSFVLTVTDECGLVGVDTAVVTLRQDSSWVSINCSASIGELLCDPDTVCFDLLPYINGHGYTIEVSDWASYDNGTVCIYSGDGLYDTLMIVATTACNVDTCFVPVNIDVVDEYVFDYCPADTSVFLCGPDTLAFELQISGSGGPSGQITVNPPAYLEGTTVMVPVLNVGTQQVVVVASSGNCGADTCIFNVTAVFNQPPVLTVEGADFRLCELQEVCLPLSAYDPDDNLREVTTSIGTIGEELCFTPDAFDTYEITVTAVDECGVWVSETIYVTITQGDFVNLEPQIDQFPPFRLCGGPDTVCFPISITGNPDSVIVTGGSFDETACFYANSSGNYSIEIIAYAECNVDTAYYSIDVELIDPPIVTCSVSDTSAFLCETPDTVAFFVDIDGSYDQVTVLPSGAWWENGVVFVPVTEAGTITVSVKAENYCGADSCSFTLTTAVNQPPMIAAENDSLSQCDFEQVCVPFTLTDADDNVYELRASFGLISGDVVCFFPDTAGVYQIILTAIDDCQAISVDTVSIIVSEGQRVSINCPTQQLTMIVDIPDTLRIPLEITPRGVQVTISPFGYYDAATGELVAYIEQAGVFDFDIIAQSECNADTCQLSVKVNQYVPPLVICQGAVDTALCLVTPETICLPVTVAGTDINVVVSSGGTFENDSICIPVDTSGTYSVRVIASNQNEADTCYTTLTVTAGNPPQVQLPDPADMTLCVPGNICIPLIVADATFDISSIEINFGLYNELTREICFQADTAGVYEIIAKVTDSCFNVVADTTAITVDFNTPPEIQLSGSTEFLCQPDTICLPLVVADDDLLFVASNIGWVDADNGLVCFVADTSGVYSITVTANDACEAMASETVDVDVSIDEAPVITNFNDSTIYLCAPQTICLTPEIIDPNNNLRNVTVSRGTYLNGQICFIPYNMGDYKLIITAEDSCGLVTVDTATITILTDQVINLACPNDTTIELCEADTLCFPIGGIPDGSRVAIGGTNVWWNEDNHTVCFYSDCCLENIITVTVTTDCGTYDCQFAVTVKTNVAPMVVLPKDTIITQCEYERICLPIGASDRDGNLMAITASGADYDSYNDLVCFTPDTAGSYLIVAMAEDSCGRTNYDSVYVTVALNGAPLISYQSQDTTLIRCELTEICLGVHISDPDNNISSVTVNGGTYNPDDGLVCFTPDKFGTYCLAITVVDSCGLTDSIDICTEIQQGDFVSIECPETPFEPTLLCDTGTVCKEIAITGNYSAVLVIEGGASWANDTLCFQADTSGTYVFTLFAVAECNVDTCVLTIPVTIFDPVEITLCPDDTTEFVCEPDTVCYPVAFSSSVDSVTVTGGFVNGTDVCVPLLQEAVQTVTMIAYGYCGTDTCSFTVTADFNEAPVVTAGPDTTLVECSLLDICINLDISDPNGNISTITASAGTLDGDSLLCFTAPDFGSYELIVTVTDECGAADQDTVVITVTEGEYASIFCPDDIQYASICGPKTICVVAPVTPGDAKVTVLPYGSYNAGNGTVCVYADSGGTYEITIIAEAQCSSDTCQFTLKVTMADPPMVVCPENVDTLLCLTSTDTLCIPVDVSGTGVVVTVSPLGYYSAGFVCLPVSEAGEYDVLIVAQGTCGVDSCTMNINIEADQSPILTLPSTLTFERCPDDTDLVCIDGIFGSDAENGVVLTKVCGPGEFTAVTPDSGQLCFLPDALGSYEFCFEATDGCQIVEGSFFVDIVMKDDCDVCVRVSIDGGECTPVGLRKSVAVNLETNDRIGGFDLLLSYDAGVLSFIAATINGTVIEEWEYFTWNTDVAGCGAACPSGLVRFVGIADQNNGAAHPPDSSLDPDGTIMFIEFQVANDQNLGDQFVPINFVWYDCADNSFSDPSGLYLYVDSRIYTYEHNLLWDENDDAAFPEESRPFGMGAADDCLTGDKSSPMRCVEFINGGICIIHPDSIDARGDINLNGLAYEISDVVLFTNYFIKGLSVFKISIPGQIAATDVNADGITLSVADLTYLIRVVIGDADPIPKRTPYSEEAVVRTIGGGDSFLIETETVGDIGAAYFVYDIDPGITIGEPVLTDQADGLTLGYGIADGQLRLLLYDIGSDRIPSGVHNLIDIPYTGDGSIRLAHSEITDYQGRIYRTTSLSSSLPTSYSLDQNYPNPFNPTTTFSFSLAQEVEWNLVIYNIAGKLVREFSGFNGAGRIEIVWDGFNSSGESVASGIYLYRLEAGEFRASRKALLLK